MGDFGCATWSLKDAFSPNQRVSSRSVQWQNLASSAALHLDLQGRASLKVAAPRPYGPTELLRPPTLNRLLLQDKPCAPSGCSFLEEDVALAVHAESTASNVFDLLAAHRG